MKKEVFAEYCPFQTLFEQWKIISSCCWTFFCLKGVLPFWYSTPRLIQQSERCLLKVGVFSKTYTNTSWTWQSPPDCCLKSWFFRFLNSKTFLTMLSKRFLRVSFESTRDSLHYHKCFWNRSFGSWICHLIVRLFRNSNCLINNRSLQPKVEACILLYQNYFDFYCSKNSFSNPNPLEGWS